MSLIQQAILSKKAALADVVSTPLATLAGRIAGAWPDPDALDRALLDGISTLPHCHLLYAWGLDAIEISSMVQPGRADTSWRGTDLSQRPYLKNHLPYKGIMLSGIYESIYTHKQFITALQAVSRNGDLLGFIAADFALDDLLQDAKLVPREPGWQQYRGDPSVRGTLFMQTRTTSLLDQNIDEVHGLIHRLMTRHGVFHVMIHYSSSRCTLWLYDDPYNYRIHGADEIVNPDLRLAYPLRDYPANARCTPEQIRDVLDEFKALRFADETIYLRVGSLNIVNGIVGLTFSCDGSHYMPVQEFREKDLSFWLGALGNPKENKAP